MKIRTILLGISAMLMLSSCGDFELLSKAKGKFSGGFGSETDPYIIKTPEDLLLMREYSDRYFKLEADIDLADQVWPKMDFSGHLNGNGHAISNLTISHTGDTLGFVSILKGTIQNLTISGININMGNANYIGGFAGYVDNGNIENCTLILNDRSKILGNEYVGGIAGYIFKTGEENILEGNMVRTSSSGYLICGSYLVGGIAGYIEGKVEVINCHVNANIYAGTVAGGIVGQFYNGTTIAACSFTGNLAGASSIGGICGKRSTSGTNSFLGCKVDATFTIAEGDVGGVQGGADSYSYSRQANCIGCYVNGKIICDNDNALNVSGFAESCLVEFCYSTMTSDHPNYYAFGVSADAKECASVAPSPGDNYTSCDRSCTNIVEFMQSCYSEYAEYFNLTNTWTWAGYINNEFVNVQCPKLYWEL